MNEPEPKKDQEEQQDEKKPSNSRLLLILALILLLLLGGLLGLFLWLNPQGGAGGGSSQQQATIEDALTALRDLKANAIRDGRLAYPDSYDVKAHIKNGAETNFTHGEYVSDPFILSLSERHDETITNTKFYTKEGETYYLSVNDAAKEVVSYNAVNEDLNLIYGLYNEATFNLDDEIEILEALKGHENALTAFLFSKLSPGSLSLTLIGEDIDLREEGQNIQKIEITYNEYRAQIYVKNYKGTAGSAEQSYTFAEASLLD